MGKAWQTLDRRETPDGVLELRQRDEDDFLICVDGRVLMNSRASRSEEALGVAACSELGPGATVLIGGLGMGLTLRAALETLHPNSRVHVAELHPVVADWCRGPLAGLCGGAAQDPRVSIRIADVADCIREAERGSCDYDAIVIDLFEGPHAGTDASRDPVYGREAIARTWRALAPGGVFGVWSEARDASFAARLQAQGFEVETRRPGRGGLRHWIVLARRPR